MKAVKWIVPIAVIILILGYFGYGALVTRDFNRICEVHREVLKAAAAAQPPPIPAQIAYDIANTIDKSIYSPIARKVYRAISFAAPSSKYELFSQGARESGVTDWSCPEMEEYWKPEAPAGATKAG